MCNLLVIKGLENKCWSAATVLRENGVTRHGGAELPHTLFASAVTSSSDQSTTSTVCDQHQSIAATALNSPAGTEPFVGPIFIVPAWVHVLNSRATSWTAGARSSSSSSSFKVEIFISDHPTSSREEIWTHPLHPREIPKFSTLKSIRHCLCSSSALWILCRDICIPTVWHASANLKF